MSDMEELLISALDQLAQLSSRVERMHRYGRILDDQDIDLSDPTKPRARIHVDDDEDGNPVKSPFVPYATIAGARNQHNPPSKGQQFLLISPDGEHEAGLLIPLGHSNDVPSPSTQAGEYVDGTGGTDIRFKANKHQLKTGDKTLHLVSSDGQRLQVESLDKLVIRFGDQAMKLKMDALEPTQDIEDYS